MSKTQSQRKPAPRPAALGRTAEERVERLPRFGPGLKIKIPLHLWPMYRQVYNLEELQPDPDVQARTDQDVLYVRRVAKPKATGKSILWRCMECINQPEMLQFEMIVHMQEVHHIDTAQAHGIRNLVMRTDAAGVYRPAFEWTINGLIFLCYEPQKEGAAHAG
jgi:hypothetical protein